jgi:hypothetical protein
VEGSCEHGDEPSFFFFFNFWEFPELLHNWQLLRKGSAPDVSSMYYANTEYLLGLIQLEVQF